MNSEEIKNNNRTLNIMTREHKKMTNGLEIHCLRLFSIKSLFNGYM